MASNSRTIITDLIKSNFLFRLYKNYIVDSILMVKNQGFKELLKRRGWKFLAVIVLYYLVRDTILYIVIPLLIARGVIN